MTEKDFYKKEGEECVAELIQYHKEHGGTPSEMDIWMAANYFWNYDGRDIELEKGRIYGEVMSGISQ